MKKEIEKQKVFAEKLNGRLAMLGFVSALISYGFTGKMFFGMF